MENTKLMNRDILKDKQHFKEHIQNTFKRKAAYIERIQALDNPQQGFINSAVTLDLFTRNLLLAKYSSGYTVRDLHNDYRESLLWFELAYNKTAFYVQLLWMISMGILLDVEQNEFNKLTTLVQKDDPEDYLIDFLLSSRREWKSNHKEFRFPIPYESLHEVITLTNDNKKVEAADRLKTYLSDEWYKGHSDEGWYDNHKSKNNTYAGYWSLESGVLVKILGLDDNILKAQPYYPYDMVHYS